MHSGCKFCKEIQHDRHNVTSDIRVEQPMLVVVYFCKLTESDSDSTYTGARRR